MGYQVVESADYGEEIEHVALITKPIALRSVCDYEASPLIQSALDTHRRGVRLLLAVLQYKQMLVTDLFDYRIEESKHDILLERLHQNLDLTVDFLDWGQSECRWRVLLLGEHVLEGLCCQANEVLLFSTTDNFLLPLLLLFLFYFLTPAGSRETASAFWSRRLSDEVGDLWRRLSDHLLLDDADILAGSEEGAEVLHLHDLVEESDEVSEQSLTILAFPELRRRLLLRGCLAYHSILLGAHH